jgi:hypothetical protein
MMARQEPRIDEAQRLEVLDRDECIELLAHESISPPAVSRTASP